MRVIHLETFPEMWSFVKVTSSELLKLTTSSIETFNFCFDPATCRILVPQPGIEPTLPAMQAGSLNH